MQIRVLYFSVLVAALLLTGCCAKFNDLPYGATYNVGSTINSSEPDIEVKPFQYANGNMTSTGTAKVDNRNYAPGSGNDLNSRNVNLHFLFDYPISKFTFKFGELGGDNNIEINNDFRYIPDLIDLHGTTIGGVNVTVNASQRGNNWYGEMKFEGDIQDFSIGGQELWIDNICRPSF